MTSVTIPDLQYIGVNLNRTSSNDIPLGFLTPGGTNAAAKKRIGTVNNWINKDTPRRDYCLISEKTEFEAKNPTAVWIADHERNDRAQYNIPRVEGIDYDIYDNVPNDPQAGFRITQMVSRSGSWNGGNKLVRIEDPRGFELEISVDNLVKVMSMTTFVNGVCQEECIWGRQGANNILLPVNSEPYMEARKTTDYRNKKAISLRDVQIGDTVELKTTEYMAGIIGQYMGSYNVYYLLNLNEVDSRSRYAQRRPTNHDMLKASKRYVIRINDEDGNFVSYKGVASAKIHNIVKRINTPMERPDIDAKDFSDISYSAPGQPAMLTLKKIKVEDIAWSAAYVPIDLDTVQVAANKKEYGSMSIWAKDPKNNKMMRYYKDYQSRFGIDDKESAAERNKLFTGQVTHINGAANEWKMSEERGAGGFGPLYILKNLTAPKALLVDQYEWFQLAFTVNGTQYKIPVDYRH